MVGKDALEGGAPIFHPKVRSPRRVQLFAAQPVPKVDRAQILSEVEVSNILHVPAREIFLLVYLLKVEVLPQHRSNLVDWTAEWNQDDGIRKQPHDRRDAGHIGVVLGHVSKASALLACPQRDHLLNVSSHEPLELPVGVRVGHSPRDDSIFRVLFGPVGAPQDLLECLGAVVADGHAVAVRAWTCGVRGVKPARNRVPQHRNQQERHVPIRVCREDVQRADDLEQDRRSRARKGCDEHRPVDLDPGETARVEAFFHICHGLLRVDGGEGQAVQDAVYPRVAVLVQLHLSTLSTVHPGRAPRAGPAKRLEPPPSRQG